MRRTALVLTAAAVLLTACGGSGDDSGASATETAPTAAVTAQTPTQGAPAPEGSESTDATPVVTASPDSAQEADLTARLTAVSPALVDDPAAAVDNAVMVCADVAAGANATTLADNAASRFTSGDDEPLTDEQAAAVVQAVVDAFCHD